MASLQWSWLLVTPTDEPKCLTVLGNELFFFKVGQFEDFRRAVYDLR